MAFFAYFISHRASGFCRQLIGFEAVGEGELVVVDTPPLSSPCGLVAASIFTP